MRGGDLKTQVGVGCRLDMHMFLRGLATAVGGYSAFVVGRGLIALWLLCGVDQYPNIPKDIEKRKAKLAARAAELGRRRERLAREAQLDECEAALGKEEEEVRRGEEARKRLG